VREAGTRTRQEHELGRHSGAVRSSIANGTRNRFDPARPGALFANSNVARSKPASGDSAHEQSQSADAFGTLPETWRSKIIGGAAGANIKVLRMDEVASGEEPHAYDEGLPVLDGELKLGIGSEVITVSAGEIFIVPANTPHAVAAGSHGTLVIIDQDE
jgi:quercetin dioxygenase-like cupin family protein